MEDRGIQLTITRMHLNTEESLSIRWQWMTAAVFITSTNAVTLDKTLDNTDSAGNLVTAMIFGLRKSSLWWM